MNTKHRASMWALRLALLLLPLLAGCDTFWFSEGSNLQTGDPRPLGNGTIRSFIRYGDDDRPVAYGVIIAEAALTGLPHGGDHESNMTTLPLPSRADGIPVDHISMDWNPHGHEPPEIYGHPHFDFHFYLISEADRNLIVPTDPEYEAKLAKPLAAPYLPAGYVPVPGGVPRMGAHWVDPTSPELNGQTFTRTFIFGSYDGHMIFIEPMITKAFIESVRTTPKKSVTFQIPQPQAYEKPGYYPTRYGISYNPRKKEYLVTLDNLVLR